MERYVVGIGEALWDVLPDGRKIGGAPANFAYHVSQFGFPTKVISAVGVDFLGDEILKTFDDKGLDYKIERVPYDTGTVQVRLDCDGVPVYDIKEGVAWDNIPYDPRLREIAERTQVVCFGSLAQRGEMSRQTILSFIDSVPNTGGNYKIFDINLRQGFYTEKIIKDSLQRCNVLKLNDDELVVVSRIFGLAEADFQKSCNALCEKYDLEILILTCGIDGSYVFSAGGISFVETPRVEIADTVGAGDSFTATFISAILKGESVRVAHEKAVRVAAFICTQHGAMPVIPDELK